MISPFMDESQSLRKSGLISIRSLKSEIDLICHWVKIINQVTNKNEAVISGVIEYEYSIDYKPIVSTIKD